MVGSGDKKVFKIYIVVDVGFLEREKERREREYYFIILLYSNIWIINNVDVVNVMFW